LRLFRDILDQYSIIIRKYYIPIGGAVITKKGIPPKHLFTFAKKLSHTV